MGRVLEEELGKEVARRLGSWAGPETGLTGVAAVTTFCLLSLICLQHDHHKLANPVLLNYLVFYSRLLRTAAR